MRRVLLLLPFLAAGLSAADDPLSVARAMEKERIELAARLAPAVCAVFRGPGGGSGVIITRDGLVLSNFHVTELENEMRIGLNDARIHEAVVLGVDPSGDLSLLRLKEPREWAFSPLGDSDALRQGDWVYAMGNPFLLATDFSPTITLGVVSGINRYQPGSMRGTLLYPDCIQTDASINPGNSGGPLINLDGEVVGINVAIRAGAQRIGFAIPIDDARKLLAKLLNPVKLSDTYHGLIGRDEKTGREMKLVVDATEPNSPAYAAGFQPGDVVERVGTVTVIDQADVERAMLGFQPGQTVDVVVQRGRERLTLTLKLARHNGAQAVAGTQPAPAETSTDKCWTNAGLKLDPAPRNQLGIHSTRYRGGMRVVEVRGGSPAAKAGIKKGDILVGLHQWETISHDNISYIFNHKQLATFGPLKFYVLRGAETLYGNLALAVDAKLTELR
jgi:serine protease Do